MTTIKFLLKPIAIILFMSALAHGQTATVYVKGVNCTPNSGNCFYNLEPGGDNILNPSNDLQYEPSYADISGIPGNATKTYNWQAVGGEFTQNTSNTSEKPWIKWNNTINYNGATPTKSLRLTVTWTWVINNTNYTYSKASIRANGTNQAQPIEVKYISTPTSVTLNGTSIPAQGYHTLACGTSTANLSV